jgi:hypothetical protein
MPSRRERDQFVEAAKGLLREAGYEGMNCFVAELGTARIRRLAALLICAVIPACHRHHARMISPVFA